MQDSRLIPPGPALHPLQDLHHLGEWGTNRAEGLHAGVAGSWSTAVLGLIEVPGACQRNPACCVQQVGLGQVGRLAEVSLRGRAEAMRPPLEECWAQLRFAAGQVQLEEKAARTCSVHPWPALDLGTQGCLCQAQGLEASACTGPRQVHGLIHGV